MVLPPSAPFFRLSCSPWVLFCCVAASLGVSALDAEEVARGAAVYAEQCASCHGGQGEGKKGLGAALRGELSVAALAKLIDETMPEDDPTACVGADALSVAAFMHREFYFTPREAAAERLFSRLTSRQHQRAVVDLLASFLGPSPAHQEFGLRGEYFDGRRMSQSERKLTRLDPVISFQWGSRSPVPGKVKTEAFCMRWQGSLLPETSGEYELIIRTNNGVRLWVNERERPLIDGWVQSGGESEHRARIHLLGGRGYYVRLEFLSFKQKDASLQLIWKPPGGEAEVIPQRCLSAAVERAAPTIATSFPPDDRSYGYERGIAVSADWDRACTDTALEAAEWAVRHLSDVARISSKDDPSTRTQKAKAFCVSLMERSARQPWHVPPGSLVDSYFGDGESTADIETAVKRCVVRTFKSPRFLFRLPTGERWSEHCSAHWLALSLWDSVPDSRLLSAAENGQLNTRLQWQAEARRMLRDPRARAKFREMMHHYLTLDRAEQLMKDSERFPGFDSQLTSALRASLDTMIDDIVWHGDGSFATLLTTAAMPVTPRIRAFYDIGGRPEEPAQRLPPWESQQQRETAEAVSNAGKFEVETWPHRSGIITHPYMLATLAYDDASSPVHRGVFLTRHVFGQRLKPPPEAVTPLPVEAHGDLTTRQRVELQTKATVCQTCHRVINPLGFSLEHFDAVGRYRERERNLSINPKGRYVDMRGETATFTGAEQLARYVAESSEAHRSFVEQLFEHAIKHPPAAFHPEMLSRLTESFRAQNLNIPELWVEITIQSLEEMTKSAHAVGK